VNWRTLIRSSDPRFLVKGAELEVALVGPASRFALYCVRTLVPALPGSRDRFDLDLGFVVRDAETVTDAQVRDGVRPAIVGRFSTLDEALAFISS